MLTIQDLQDYGVNTKEGLARCMNMEAFYLKMINKGLKNEAFDKLEKLLAEGNKEEAFEQAHAIKGVAANLAITPIYAKITVISDSLKADIKAESTGSPNDKKDLDYVSLYKPVKDLRDELVSKL